MSEKTVPVQFIVPSLFLVPRLNHLHVLVHFPVPGENSQKKSSMADSLHSERSKLQELIKVQGEIVRKLKSEKADKDKVCVFSSEKQLFEICKQSTSKQIVPTKSWGSSSVLFAYSFLLLFGQFDNIYKVEQDSLYFFS